MKNKNSYHNKIKKILKPLLNFALDDFDLRDIESCNCIEVTGWYQDQWAELYYNKVNGKYIVYRIEQYNRNSCIKTDDVLLEFPYEGTLKRKGITLAEFDELVYKSISLLKKDKDE